MPSLDLFPVLIALAPLFFMLTALLLCAVPAPSTQFGWNAFAVLSSTGLVLALVALLTGTAAEGLQPWLHPTPLGGGLAILVQLLGCVIGAFSSRYLQGEPRQQSYVTALAGVLAAVHLLLLADHWVVLIAGWALVGIALQPLLCYYPERPFALLAAHKKRIADRTADVLLLAAAALAWRDVGSGSLSDLHAHVLAGGMSPTLHLSAVCLVLAVMLRTALLPVHGWLIQVMEAPTPVSALLHAGVVNLGGFVLIRFAPLLEHAWVARWLLVALGLGTAVLAGLVMLTRVSIKVRLAWSTVAQMGFMVLECGLGLYTLAAMHMVGHSLYKVHAFLGSSTVVRQTRFQMMRGPSTPAPASLVLAPAAALLVVLMFQVPVAPGAWPWWWSVVLGLAWAPLLWLPAGTGASIRTQALRGLWGLLMVGGLTVALLLVHSLPLALPDKPDPVMGMVALAGMAALYLCLVALQLRPQALTVAHRWSYAGFYVDEIYTRVALRLWPARWAPDAAAARRS